MKRIFITRLLHALNAELVKKSLPVAIVFSLSLHTFLLFGVAILPPENLRAEKSLQPLEVVLVNSKSRQRPSQATALAQHNLDGGGNTADDRHAKSPLITTSDSTRITPEQSMKHVQQLEQEAKRLMTQLKSNYSIPPDTAGKPATSEQTTGEDMVQRALEMARLEAQIDKAHDAYEKLPRRKFLGARAQEYRYAQYIEDWRGKIERIGTLNYPQQARDLKLYGSLRLTVSIRADGSVENVEINRSSGQRILDAAAIRIVKLAAPYAPFPSDIRKETDILSITRTWTFTSNEHLESE